MAAAADPAPRAFDPGCRRCPRLSAYLDEVRRRHPDYHAAPVASFGDPAARLVIVGLAPGMHGANATGRPFTGDHAGLLLYRTLHAFGYADRPESRAADDGLGLVDCRITNAVRCVPPGNRPETAEVHRCNPFLAAELGGPSAPAVILALGGIAHRATLRALGIRPAAAAFGHAATHPLDAGRWLVDSYHCSRYNTQTGRLTEPMFHDVFRQIAKLLGRG